MLTKKLTYLIWQALLHVLYHIRIGVVYYRTRVCLRNADSKNVFYYPEAVRLSPCILCKYNFKLHIPDVDTLHTCKAHYNKGVSIQYVVYNIGVC